MPTATLLLLAAAWLAPPAVVHGKRLDVTLTSGKRGRTVRLVAEVRLAPGVHVYAAGAEGYLPLEWNMEEQPGWTAGAVRYPAARKLYLEAIGETVPVYQGSLRLEREMTPARGAKTAILRGTLRYQACDDRMCYRPETLTLEWPAPGK